MPSHVLDQTTFPQLFAHHSSYSNSCEKSAPEKDCLFPDPSSAIVSDFCRKSECKQFISWSSDATVYLLPNSKCVSVLGQNKCNSSSLLNHRLIHVTFLTCQTCVQSDFTMVGLGPSAKKVPYACSPFCATITVGTLSFPPLIYAWNKQISSEKASKIYCTGDLHLQLPDIYLEFGTGYSMENWLVFLMAIGCLLAHCLTNINYFTIGP